MCGPAELFRVGVCRGDAARESHAFVDREQLGPHVEDVDVELAAAAEPSESIEDLVARKDLTKAVERAMARLPEEQRTAIILKEYQGLTFQEIADLVGCPLSTVKTRLYQGLIVLRRELTKHERAGTH